MVNFSFTALPSAACFSMTTMGQSSPSGRTSFDKKDVAEWVNVRVAGLERSPVMTLTVWPVRGAGLLSTSKKET